MNPQDILNTQHHGNQAVELLRQVQVHLQQSNNPYLAEQIDAVRILAFMIENEVKSCG
jgi:hypothetical protein